MDTFNIFQAGMFANSAENTKIRRQRFKGIDLATRSDSTRQMKCVNTRIRANIQHSGARRHNPRKCGQFRLVRGSASQDAA
jgi:hypothetical protein